MTYDEIVQRIGSGRYHLKAIARDTGLQEKTIQSVKYGHRNPRPRTVRLLAEWLRNPRDLRKELLT